MRKKWRKKKKTLQVCFDTPIRGSQRHVSSSLSVLSATFKIITFPFHSMQLVFVSQVFMSSLQPFICVLIYYFLFASYFSYVSIPFVFDSPHIHFFFLFTCFISEEDFASRSFLYLIYTIVYSFHIVAFISFLSDSGGLYNSSLH